MHASLVVSYFTRFSKGGLHPPAATRTGTQHYLRRRRRADNSNFGVLGLIGLKALD